VNRLKSISLGVGLALVALGFERPVIAQNSGTLIVKVENYTSDGKMSKRVQKLLEHAGMRWGVLEGNVVITQVKEDLIKANLPYLTRDGEQTSVEMKAGAHTITCVGYEFDSTSRDVDKTLSKSAYFNQDVLAFTILPGKTTTLDITPDYERQSQWWRLSKVTIYLPDLKVRVLEDGVPGGEAIVISQRTPKSVPWDDYHGPLKF
jgi:hypothetical protein